MRRHILLTVIITTACYGYSIAQEKATVTVPQETGQQQFQEVKHELYAGYGLLSLPILVNLVGDAFGEMLFSGDSRKLFVGPAMLGYNYSASEKINVGIQASFTSYSNRQVGTGYLISRKRYYTLMPHAKINWFKKGAYLYSGLKIGACYVDTTPEDVYSQARSYIAPAFHLTVMGVRFGKKKNIFVDGGLGFDGFLNAGMFLPLHK